MNTADKVRPLDAALAWRRRQQGRVVFTNGVFDLLHPGHLALLEAARAEGDALIVGVNSDASVRRLGKGTDRPLVPEEARARLLAGFAAVDCVVLFDEDTPLALIELAARPTSWSRAPTTPATRSSAPTSWRRAAAASSACQLVPDHSTTRLVERLRASS